MTSSVSLDSSQDLATALAKSYPPLGRYCPHLKTVSVPQAVFLLDDRRESGYGGAAGGGKSDALLMAALQYVDVEGYNALILRRTFPELRGAEGLLVRAQTWLKRTDARASEEGKLWSFPSGATLRFGHCETDLDRFNYDGQAYQFVGFDELTSFTEEQYDHIGFTRMRSSPHLHVPLRTRGSCTPTGVGYGWVKSRFIKHRKPDVLFVPAKVRDNPDGIDADEYEAGMARIPEELRRRLLNGDWDAFEGAAYEVTDVHLVEKFVLRDSINRFEAADYGLNGTPWALWATDYESNVVCVDMIYERDKIPSEVAPVVLMKRKAGWGFGHDAFMDPSVWHRTGTRNKLGRPAMLADEFGDAGVPVAPANNDPRAGMMRLRELLRPDPAHSFPDWHPRAGQKGSPRLFFVRRTTEAFVEEMQSAPLQPPEKADGGEKVDPDWESRHGHACAMARYAVMTRPVASKRAYEPLDDPRAEALRRHEAKRDRGAARAPNYDW